MPSEIVIRMTSTRETKGTFVFVDADQDAVHQLRTLYVPKGILNALGAKGDIEVVIRPAPPK